ncbi:plasmid pRiA4b ORF-3 family protein [Streptomyces litchfieldiae]|uniref:Plasmid pRiA4b ORF-3 family protein n=1 Tax=Streptomyces litchfieldiae TaxID=3075543 RepID=A0ABU2ML62_9ACTN|nr:plasmid pRiA4b ORF-3 family protein [Streptomyces sp. DSM 44938]MDT0341864.1 plasmid pRiA4b ORF-3 family protein [Streptomyces sp. DSM 44938]
MNAPAPTFPRLAEAARSCRLATSARTLATWLGPGRAVTPAGMPKPSDAPAAAAALGIPAPRRVRRVADIPELGVAWRFARAAGFVSCAGGRGSGAAAEADWAHLSPETVLRRWLDALSAAIPFGGGTERPRDDDEHATCVALLLSALSTADDPGDAGRVTARIYEMVRGDEWPLSYRGSFLRNQGEHEVDRLHIFLLDAGAADDTRGLTPLGSWALEQLRPARISPRMSTADLLGELERRPPRDPYLRIWPWVEAQGPDAALRGLLAEAERAGTPRRRLALELAAPLPVDSDEPWHRAAAHPVLGPPARLVLLQNDPTPGAASPRDLLWLAVDECAEAWLHGDTRRLLERFHDLPGATGPERLNALRGSSHPDAAALADHLKRSGAEQSQPSVYQLKISLTGWGTWRRVLVRPTLTLGDLHEVIRTVLDWNDDHLHLFRAPDRRTYAPAWCDLDADDEETVLVADAFPHQGSTMDYTYDLGDCWRHEITFQKILAGGPGTDYPVCTAGQGDSPIEDSTPEDEGAAYPATPFLIDDINERLIRHFFPT